MELELFDDFSFNLGSDSENEEVDVLAQEEKEKKAREVFLLKCKDYTPFGGKKKWFSLGTKETVVDRIRSRKNAGSEIKHILEYHYLKKDYQAVVEIGEDFLENIGLSKVNNTKELIEILIRARLQLGDYTKALSLVENWAGSSEPGQIFLKAQVFSLVGDLENSLYLFRRYLLVRPNDYLAWKEIGLAFERFYHEEARVLKDNTRASACNTSSNIATLCFEKSQRLMNNSKWNVEAAEYVRIRYERESEELERYITSSYPIPELSSYELSQDIFNWISLSTSSLDDSRHPQIGATNNDLESDGPGSRTERSALAL